MSDYTEAVESTEQIENHIYYHCKRCFVCGEKIMPRDKALTLDGEHYFHDSHPDETTGEELALEDGADPDVMDQWLDMN